MKSHLTSKQSMKKAIDREWESKQNEFFELCKKDISAQILAVCMLTLKTRFGFGKKRMNDFYNDFIGTCKIMDKDLIFGKSFSTVDCIEMIKKDYGIDLDRGF
jgi:hypothetical protein